MGSPRTTGASSRETAYSTREQDSAQDDKDKFSAKKLEGKIEKSTQDTINELW